MSERELIVKMLFLDNQDLVHGALYLSGCAEDPGFARCIAGAHSRPLKLDVTVSSDLFLEKLADIKARSPGGERFFQLIEMLERYFGSSYPQSRFRRIFEIAWEKQDTSARNAAIAGFLREDLSALLRSDKIDCSVDCVAPQSAPAVPRAAPDQVPVFMPPAGSIVLETDPMIDPVSGFSLQDMKPGDYLLVRIIDKSQVGWHVARSITGSSEPEQQELQCKIVNIAVRPAGKGMASEIAEVYVNLSDGSVLGHFECQLNTKMKAVLGFAPDAEKSAAEAGGAINFIPPRIETVILGFAVTMLLIVTIYLFFSFIDPGYLPSSG
ncbi:MAG: hypothetical protein PHQ23_08870 [Candidatus Wallbacteria bacterium]|nr:hypothetical protein [Candidatus Wallbacteria bacterium]